MAQRDAQDGVSFVQTVEGALSETTNILQRIRELAVQAANGSNSTQNRTDLDLEVAELINQTDAISSNTEFNDVNPIVSGGTTIILQIGADGNQVLAISSLGADSVTLGNIATADLATSTDTAGAAITLADAALLAVNMQRASLAPFRTGLSSRSVRWRLRRRIRRH